LLQRSEYEKHDRLAIYIRYRKSKYIKNFSREFSQLKDYEDGRIILKQNLGKW
jgi:hypothetical protein